MKKIFNIIVLLCTILFVQTNAHSNGSEISEGQSEVLSRKKRFIVFPEGSSLQLVFCTTYPMVFKIGDIFLYGSTAALAWDLPKDPLFPLDSRIKPSNRRADSKVIYYNDDGKIVYKRPYKRKSIVNPAFAKRSVDSANMEIEKSAENFKIDRKQMHTHNRRFLNAEAEQRTELHRSSRASLYQKIETMLRGLGRTDGKQCLLKTLCIVGKTNKDPQGTFLQEILRSVFSLPKGSTEALYKEYEAAHYASESCDVLFPECSEAPLEPNSPIFSY